MCQPASLISQPATLTACARGAEHERYIFRGMTQGGGGARTREKVAGRVRTVARNAKQASLSSTVGRSAWRDGREVVNQLPERSWTTSYVPLLAATESGWYGAPIYISNSRAAPS